VEARTGREGTGWEEEQGSFESRAIGTDCARPLGSVRTSSLGPAGHEFRSLLIASVSGRYAKSLRQLSRGGGRGPEWLSHSNENWVEKRGLELMLSWTSGMKKTGAETPTGTKNDSLE